MGVVHWSQKSNFVFWNNTHRECKINSNFPNQLLDLSTAASCARPGQLTRKLVSDDLGRVFFSIDCKTLPLMGFLVPSESLYIEENIER